MKKIYFGIRFVLTDATVLDAYPEAVLEAHYKEEKQCFNLTEILDGEDRCYSVLKGGGQIVKEIDIDLDAIDYLSFCIDPNSADSIDGAPWVLYEGDIVTMAPSASFGAGRHDKLIISYSSKYENVA